MGQRQTRRPDQRGQCTSLLIFPNDSLTLGSQNENDRFKDIPVDRRHLEARLAKAKSGKLKRDLAGGIGRYSSPPSIKDFPKSWLPRPSNGSQKPATTETTASLASQ